MAEHSALARLIAGYFHQDVFDVYGDEFAAVDAFLSADPGTAETVPSEITDLLDRVQSERELRTYLDELGCDIEPDPGVTYREWLTRIADRVRAAGR